MKRICMKKLFLLALAALMMTALLSCSSDDGEGDDGNVSGQVNGGATLTVKNASSYTLYDVKWCGEVISSAAGIALGASAKEFVSEGFGYVYFSFYPNSSDVKMQCYTVDALDISNGDAASFTFTNNTVVVQLDDVENKAALGRLKFRTTTLSIKNSSSYDLVDTAWQTYTFSSNPLDSVLEKDSEIANNVETGYGYVYFTRKDTGISVRTKSVVFVNDLNSEQFEITDATEVVEVNNEQNVAALSNIEKKVVFFDSAEGDYYPYTKRTAAKYSFSSYVHSGKYSIDLDEGELELSIYLDKNAYLSLWYESSNAYTSLYEVNLSINGEVVKNWSGKHQWEFYKTLLSAGSNVICFTSDRLAYAHLDDILIVYTD
ncbi:MAG: hypothetical protein K2J81_06015 [Treponemataceae bacterium]|nr:hypothetical protein [Treponemataceae bacterium]